MLGKQLKEAVGVWQTDEPNEHLEKASKFSAKLAANEAKKTLPFACSELVSHSGLNTRDQSAKILEFQAKITIDPKVKYHFTVDKDVSVLASAVRFINTVTGAVFPDGFELAQTGSSIVSEAAFPSPENTEPEPEVGKQEPSEARKDFDQNAARSTKLFKLHNLARAFEEYKVLGSSPIERHKADKNLLNVKKFMRCRMNLLYKSTAIEVFGKSGELYAMIENRMFLSALNTETKSAIESHATVHFILTKACHRSLSFWHNSTQ